MRWTCTCPSPLPIANRADDEDAEEGAEVFAHALDSVRRSGRMNTVADASNA